MLNVYINVYINIKILRVHVLLILMLKNFQEQFKTFVDKVDYSTLKTFSQLIRFSLCLKLDPGISFVSSLAIGFYEFLFRSACSFEI